MRRVALHPVVIILCIKLDAECDRQATIIGRLLTTLADDGRAVAKGWRNAPEGMTLMFGDIQISYICFINIVQLQGSLFHRPEAMDPGMTKDPVHWLEISAHNDCIDLPT